MVLVLVMTLLAQSPPQLFLPPKSLIDRVRECIYGPIVAPAGAVIVTYTIFVVFGRSVKEFPLG